jgi:hypothetical protein
MPVEPRVETVLRLATSAVEAAQPLFAAVGGGAAVGSVLGVAWEARSEAPQWDRAAAIGSMCGALVGAGLIVADLARSI